MKLKNSTGRPYFWQWDLNQKLIVEDDCTCKEVHFCNRASKTSLVCLIEEVDGERIANVPNILLQADGVITAYLCSRTDNGVETRLSRTFQVRPRAKPESYVYTETEVLNYHSLAERIDQIEQNGVSDERIGEAVADYLEGQNLGKLFDVDWMATKEETGDNTVYIPEQKASGLWNNLQASLKAGSVYDVTINGEVYVCTAVEDDGVLLLGNNPSLTLNEYPFCITWAGAGATAGMFFKNSNVISSPVTLKVTGHYEVVYNQLPEEYLPDGVVKSVNGKKPYANGNVEIPTGTVTNEQIASAVEDYMAEHPVSGLNNTEKSLMLSLFRKAAYTDNMSETIAQLESLWNGGEVPDIPDVPDVPVVTKYTITNELVNVKSSNSTSSVNEGASYTATLTAVEGYEISNVTVTMGGADVTASVYANGVVNIASVTGNVEIVASAVVVKTEAALPEGGLIAFFDLRNAENVTIGGGYGFNSTKGSGSLYSWYKADAVSEDGYGYYAGQHTLSDAGTTTNKDIGTEYTILALGRLKAESGIIAINDNASGNLNRWVQPKYTDSSGSEKTVSDKITFALGAEDNYDAFTVRVNGTIYDYFVNTTHIHSFDGADIEGFANWPKKAIFKPMNYKENAWITAIAIYSRALSDIEITESLAYFKTLEVA